MDGPVIYHEKIPFSIPWLLHAGCAQEKRDVTPIPEFIKSTGYAPIVQYQTDYSETSNPYRTIYPFIF